MAEFSTTSQLDPKRTALLVVDVQRVLFNRPMPIHKADEILQNINSLIETWRGEAGLVVFIQHSNNKILVKNSAGWQFHPDLKVKEGDLIVHKEQGDAFKDTELKKILDANDIRNIVVTGLVTNGCVRATCLGGLKLSYHVILVTDAHSNYRKDAPMTIEKLHRELRKQRMELFSTDEITHVDFTI